MAKKVWVLMSNTETKDRLDSLPVVGSYNEKVNELLDCYDMLSSLARSQNVDVPSVWNMVKGISEITKGLKP